MTPQDTQSADQEASLCEDEPGEQPPPDWPPQMDAKGGR